MSNVYTILTQIGLAKIVNAITLGEALNITQVAVGDAVITPAPTMTALGHEVWRGTVHSIMKDPENPTQIIVEAIVPKAVGGWTAREIGLFDAANDLIAIGTLAPVDKEPNVVALTVTVVFNIGANQSGGLQLLSPNGMATMDWALSQFIPRQLQSKIALNGDDYIPFVRQGQPMAVLWDVLRTLLGSSGGSGTANGGNADTAALATRLDIKPWDLAANTSGAGAPATFVEAGAGGTVGGVTLSAPDAEGWQTLSGADLAAPFMWTTTGATAVSGRHAWAVKVPDNVAYALYPALMLYIIDGAASAAAVMAAAANQGQSPGTDVTAVQAFPQAMTLPATMAAQGLDMPLGATQPSPLTGAPPQPVGFSNVALGDVFRVGVDVATGEVYIGYQDGAEVSLGTSALLAGKTSLQILCVFTFAGTPRTGSVYLDASAPLGATVGLGGGATISLPPGTMPGTFLDIIGTGRYRQIPLKNEEVALVRNVGGDIINLGRQDLSLYVTQQQLAALAATVKPKSVPSGAVPYGTVQLLTSEGLVKWLYPGTGMQLFDRGGYIEIVNDAPTPPPVEVPKIAAELMSCPVSWYSPYELSIGNAVFSLAGASKQYELAATVVHSSALTAPGKWYLYYDSGFGYRWSQVEPSIWAGPGSPAVEQGNSYTTRLVFAIYVWVAGMLPRFVFRAGTSEVLYLSDQPPAALRVLDHYTQASTAWLDVASVSPATVVQMTKVRVTNSGTAPCDVNGTLPPVTVQPGNSEVVEVVAGTSPSVTMTNGAEVTVDVLGFTLIR